MAEDFEENVPSELPALPGAPWATMLTALVVLLVFGGLLALVLGFADNVSEKSINAAGEQQLRELRTQENEILDHYGWDEATKTWRIPIDRAMNVLIEEGKAKGDIQSFPVVPKHPSKEK